MNYVEEIRSGNHAVFEELYYTYHERFYFYVLKNTQSNTIAEEVIQTAFMKLWETRKKLSTEFAVEVQLARIVRSLMVDVLRKKITEKKALTAFKESVDIVINIHPVENKQLNEKLTTVIDDLPPECKKIFTLSREGGLTYNQIADNLSVSPKTVENQIAKALKRVRDAAEYY